MNSLKNLQYNSNFRQSSSWLNLQNCIIYARQSTADQKSLEEQTTACEDYAASMGYYNASVFTHKESAWKGGNFDGLKMHFRKVRKHMNISTLFVYDVSRFTRDVKSALKMIDILDDFNITVVSVIDGATWNNTRKSQEEFMEKMLEAQKFSTALSERIKRKNEYLSSMGAQFGNPPYGFKAVKDDKGIRKFIKNDEEMYVIAMIYSRLDTDCDFDKIAAELNSLKYYKRGREWDKNLVKNLHKKPEFNQWAQESMYLLDDEIDVIEHSICCEKCQKWVVCEKEFADIMSNPSCQYICPDCV